MVGCLLGAALAVAPVRGTKPLKVCVLEDRLPQAFQPGSEPDYDLRVSALSIGSQRILESVGAWQGIVSRRAAPYARLSVWDGEQTGRTDFNANDIHVSHLGHIVENRVIQLALLERANELEHVDVISPVRMQRFSQTKTGVSVLLDDGRAINASLLVGADGANSQVRSQAGIALDKKMYEQHALVATVLTDKPQQDITWQRFVPSGPQAMLPLCGHRASLVWYHDAETVSRLKALDDAEFLLELHQAFPEDLGHVEKVYERGSFPIAKAHAAQYISNRVALVGDAAHTVHPLAGQGVNLGMLDAAALAQVVLLAASKRRDFGAHEVLRRYQRWRYAENQIMINALDAIHESFKPRPSWFQLARSASLSVVDRVAPLRVQLMRHAMGISGDLPDMAMDLS